MTIFDINGRKVGDAYPPLVIAELGINHNGLIQTAKEMVDAACKSGAEVIKHQTHVIKDEMSQAAKKVIPGNSNVSIYEIMKQCALSEADEILLKEYVESKDMIFISTPFSRAAADRLERMDVPAYKIGSGECNNYPLLEHIAKKGKPIILSTGMNTIDSVQKAVKIFECYDIQYALLHTTNLYPTPSNLVRLGGMQKLAEAFPKTVIGLSDHTTSNYACFAAVALGANILERHFTDRMDRPGPDIINSMDPIALKELLIGSCEISKMRGGEKEPAKEEQVTIAFAFATIVTTAEVKKGEYFTKQNIWVKRPGKDGIPAEFYSKVLGMKATQNIANDCHLKWEDMVE
ncbi:MAG: N-acetylneuraminate synthase family protein [gamma proteobacterium symbiont of Taylorina sp.]|nr:N-acetylneuraminate synthase family protein [gamma proteobacterium symbiont of Taylorina sp.]